VPTEPGVGRLRRGPLAAAAAALALGVATAVVLAMGDGDPSRRAALRAAVTVPSAGVPDDPVVLSDCWVPTLGGNVALTDAQAEALTERAARVARRSPPSRAVDALVRPVQAATRAAGPAARSVALALLGGRGPDGLVCAAPRGPVDPERMGPSGLTPRAVRLKRAWTATFGPLPAGGYAHGGVSSGHVDNSAHYEGRAVDVFFRPLGSAAQRRAGWVFAQWVVAHAARYHVLSAIYDDHIWTSWAASLGWRDYQHPGGPTRNPVLRHLDHVHVAVESGRPFRPR
jgi:hypothetical protein